MDKKLEIIGFDLEGCTIAERYGADRIELCHDPHLGGTSPSIQLLKEVKKVTQIPIYCMVRIRGGGFKYSKQEVSAMVDQISGFLDAGSDGFVFGALDEYNAVDLNKCEKLLKAAENKPCTFHRAFDIVKDIEMSLKQIIELGFSRILTSGQKDTALAGKYLIKDLIDLAKNQIVIMPGAGVTSQSIFELDSWVDAKEYHSSAKLTTVDGTYCGVDPSEVKIMKKYLGI